MHSANLYLLKGSDRLGRTYDLQEARTKKDVFLVSSLPLDGPSCFFSNKHHHEIYWDKIGAKYALREVVPASSN